MEKQPQSSSVPRRTLAQALKRLFKSMSAKSGDKSLNVPVEIIRRDVSRISYLPPISRVSLFPNFDTAEIDFESLNARVPSPSVSVQAGAGITNHGRLLPAKSLSYFNLHEVYSEQSDLSHLLYPPGGMARSRQVMADATTGRVPSHKPVLVSKKSTLQIRRPDVENPSNRPVSQVAEVVTRRSSSLRRKTSGVSDLRKCAKEGSLATDTRLTTIAESTHSTITTTTSESTESTRSTINRKSSTSLVRHFASFCVIDVLAPGCPISAVSEDLRYLYDVKDRFVLNAQECTELSMDLSIGRDANGNEVTYLMLFSPLVVPGTSTARFMLVSAIDVSGYVRYAASLESVPEQRGGVGALEKEQQVESLAPSWERSTSVFHQDRTYELLADDLLGGCSIQDTAPSAPKTTKHGLHGRGYTRRNAPAEDVWVTIAREEGLASRNALTRSDAIRHASAPFKPAADREPRQTAAPPTKSEATLNCADETVLGEFIEDLQVLYSEYFLLACSPINDQFYEICYVSPSVYASGEYVTGHLTHMSPSKIARFGAHLAEGHRFKTLVRWGNQGLEKQLFCIPLIGQQPVPWLCMIVDKDTPIQW
jgi:hypothetical protein